MFIGSKYTLIFDYVFKNTIVLIYIKVKERNNK